MAQIKIFQAINRAREITVVSLAFIASKIRPLLAIGFLLLLNLIAIETLRLINILRSTAITAQRTANEWSETALRQQRQIDLLFRQADDVARIMDNAQGIMRKLNRETVPELNGLTRDTRKLIQRSTILVDETTVLIIKSRDGVEILLKETDVFIQQATGLLSRIKLDGIIENLEDFTLSAKGTMINVEASSREITKWLPDVLKEIKVIAEHMSAISDRGKTMSEEMAALFKRINRPLSKKEKFVNLMLRVLVAVSPSVVEALRR